MIARRWLSRATLLALVCLGLPVTQVDWSAGQQPPSKQEPNKKKRQPAAPRFDSQVVTTKIAGHAVAVDVDIAGAKELHLVVTDGGNGFACDWADWAEPRLVAADGKELKLTELKWKSAAAGWGQTRVNQNAEGGPLRINGQAVAYGIGTHANSVIAFDLPSGYVRFKARAGLDNGGTDQGGGGATSVRFLVFTERPPARLLAASEPAAEQDSGNRDPAHALDGLDVAPGLEATVFAAEPTMLSPSNIDVDHRGRVWVCEVVNYRHRLGSRPEGDRILILEDTDGDGKADKTRVFHQGRDIDTAHGICVLGTPNDKGTRVILSVGSGVYLLTDDDGDLKSDRKTTLFTGVSGVQHDHGIHAFLFGPDGKLYFNFGNEGRQIKDAGGKPIVDMAGNTVQAGNGAAEHRKPYQQGMVFRCNMDGSEFETLGWNFRNNWEVTIDSFGTLWQSDNDDDGNRGVRINYVMEFGNYGYHDEFTGANWNTPYTGQPADIPSRHWHLTDPGVVPNVLLTGAGSPTGICVYEGALLPEKFRNQMIHCDAGPNVVRAYPVTSDGAGYKGEMVNILEGTRDKWFRPSDVCVAPDGSLIIADWYDPGVGGHRMGDIERGRIFRVAPPKTDYKAPKLDLSTAEGAIEGLKSPNLATRYLAWTALNALGAGAEMPLAGVLRTSEDQRLRARVLWLLSKIPACGREYVEEALGDRNPDIRITALRAARQMKLEVIPYIKQLAADKSPQVRRECLIALRHNTSADMPTLWANLARGHDGRDRWYLEALGIAADKQWDTCLDAWLALGKLPGDFGTPEARRDIIWRSRARKTPELLVEILRDPAADKEDPARYLRAFDFLTVPEKDAALLELAFSSPVADTARTSIISTEAIRRLKNVDLKANPKYEAALADVLKRSPGTPQFIELVDKFSVKEKYGDLLALAQQKPDEQLGIDAARVLLAKDQQAMLSEALGNKDEKLAAATARALGNSADGRIVGLLRPIALDTKQPLELRRAAARSMAKTLRGAKEILALARQKKLDEAIATAAAFELHSAPAQWGEIKAEAEKLFPLPPARNNEKLPPISQLVKMQGDVARGAKVYTGVGTCAKCHKVNGEGKDVGPDLSAIGAKLSREAFFESVLYPSAGISHNYEVYILQLESGNTVSGVLTSQTAESVTLVTQEAVTLTFKRSEIERMAKSNISMMPADLQKVMSAQELVDVVEYLGTLKQAKKAPSSGERGASAP